MSTPEPGQHPWDRFYAAQGKDRVEKMLVTKSGQTVVPFAGPGGSRPPLSPKDKPEKKDAGSRPPTDARMVIPPPALARPTLSPPPAAPDAAEPKKIDWHTRPIVELIDAASQQRAESEAEAQRLRDAWSLLRLFGFGLVAVVLAVVAFDVVQLLANDVPPAEQLAAEGDRVAATVLRQLAAPAQPQRVQSVRAQLFSRPEKGRADYDLVITLELTAPLHALADSNGAQAYLQLQRALGDAYARVMARPALRTQPALQALPVLPPLFAVTHKRGERTVVRVPLAASRRGLHWELAPRLEQRHQTTPALTGEILERLPRPHLVFNTPAGRDEMRRLMGEARDYIVRANKAAATRAR